MNADRHRQLILTAWFLMLLPSAMDGQERPAAFSTRPEQEAFLSRADIVGERRTPGRTHQWRITLDDGQRKHDASVETEDGTTPTRRNYRFNVAAYELDKLLELHFVAPSVIRTVNGQPASLTWWVDDVAMDEPTRRAKKIDPPDAELWDRHIQAVRLVDELMSNAYRNVDKEQTSPATDDEPAKSYNWGELIVLRDWRVALIDHTATFRARKQLEHPSSLTRCDRGLLGKLRMLTRNVFEQRLGKYLSPAQLDALEARRALLVKHFDELIARNGEAAVLYDLPPRP